MSQSEDNEPRRDTGDDARQRLESLLEKIRGAKAKIAFYQRIWGLLEVERADLLRDHPEFMHELGANDKR